MFVTILCVYKSKKKKKKEKKLQSNISEYQVLINISPNFLE